MLLCLLWLISIRRIIQSRKNFISLHIFILWFSCFLILIFWIWTSYWVFINYVEAFLITSLIFSRRIFVLIDFCLGKFSSGSRMSIANQTLRIRCHNWLLFIYPYCVTIIFFSAIFIFLYHLCCFNSWTKQVVRLRTCENNLSSINLTSLFRG